MVADTPRAGERFTGTLEEAYGIPVRLRVRVQPEGAIRIVVLAEADVVQGADVRTALAPAIGQGIEVEVRTDSGGSEPIADAWWYEPVIEDGEVEYVARLHLRALLARDGLLQ